MTLTGLANNDPRDQIASIEADIEHLTKALERCRKAMVLAKVAIAAGVVCIMAYFLGPIWLDPTIMIGAIAGIVGGIVLLGSNSSTSKQTMAALRAAETQRTKLIDMIEPRTVDVSGVVTAALNSRTTASQESEQGPAAAVGPPLPPARA